MTKMVLLDWEIWVFLCQKISNNNYIVNGFDTNENVFNELKKFKIIKNNKLKDLSNERNYYNHAPKWENSRRSLD